jgi:cell division protein FtsQ
VSGTRSAPAGKGTAADRRKAGAVSQTSARRFARRQWRRRLRRARPLLVLVALVVVAGFAVWAVWFSSLFDVRTVTVTGLPSGSPLTTADIRSAARVPMREPLARVDLDAAAAGVRKLPAVEAATVSRAWPHDVLIEVTERKPVAAWRSGGSYQLVDADSVAFRTVTSPPVGLVPITIQPKARQRTEPTLRSAVDVLTSLPAGLKGQVAGVSAQSPDTVRLALRSGATVVWGSAEQSAQKAKVLAALLKQRPEREIKIYDVSVPTYPTTRS